LAALVGCNGDPYADVRYSDDVVKFRDDVDSNVELDDSLEDGLSGLTFTDAKGQRVDLSQYRGQKHVVLVVTRGYGAGICLYCATQTSRLVEHYDEFAKRDAEIVVVFPVENPDLETKLDAFVEKTYEKLGQRPQPTPFPLLLDVDLAAVDKLGIRQDLAKPATYILDKEGRVCFAYVGETLSDRPSLIVVLEELDRLQAAEKGSTSHP
jgi:peroxiredoxin